MDLPWGDERSTKFVTNVGLITSDGPIGPNVMAAEWTHHISYEPGLILVCIRPTDSSHENVAASKEFGVCLAASDQNLIASIAGNYKGREIDKIGLLSELGCQFKKAKHIRAPLVEGAAMTAECKVIQQLTLGSHTLFIGEILDAVADASKLPLVYNRGKYWQFGDQIHKPSMEELDRQKDLVEKYSKMK